jgi:hypothetical protein
LTEFLVHLLALLSRPAADLRVLRLLSSPHTAPAADAAPIIAAAVIHWSASRESAKRHAGPGGEDAQALSAAIPPVFCIADVLQNARKSLICGGAISGRFTRKALPVHAFVGIAHSGRLAPAAWRCFVPGYVRFGPAKADTGAREGRIHPLLRQPCIVAACASPERPPPPASARGSCEGREAGFNV